MIAPLPIARNLLLSAIAPRDLARLAPHHLQTTFEVGQIIQDAEVPVKQVWFPLSGLISLSAVMTSGASVDTALVGCEGVIGGFVGLGPWSAFCRAVVAIRGQGVLIPAPRFQEVAFNSKGIRNLVLQYKERLLAQVQQTAACNALHSVEQRLARWLLQAQDRVDGKTLPLTQEFLAQMLGVRRTSVTLSAQNLERAGLIRYLRADIEILDRAGLEATACECYAAIHRREVSFVQQISGAKVAYQKLLLTQ